MSRLDDIRKELDEWQGIVKQNASAKIYAEKWVTDIAYLLGMVDGLMNVNPEPPAHWSESASRSKRPSLEDSEAARSIQEAVERTANAAPGVPSARPKSATHPEWPPDNDTPPSPARQRKR